MQSEKFILIAGPCVIESESMLDETAATLKSITDGRDVDFYFKASYKKANRTSYESFTGIGDERALNLLADTAAKYGLRTITDVHTAEEAEMAAAFVDALQIPAFLSRQTELLIAAARTGKQINIKKAQFMAPEDMHRAADKVSKAGNKQIWLTERGTFYGYHDLVVDYRSLLIMRQSGYPVIYDATHSVQQPSRGAQSGGRPEFIRPLARAASATGIDGIFFETHPDPANAKSDAASQLPLNLAENFLNEILEIHDIISKK
ncbi:MAG: 3-deoxy-8-phosphooctulonate synthase [Candidatus Kapaibacterium sp.]